MKGKDLLKKYAKQVYELGLVWGTSGNMSIRMDADSFLITATGKSLKEIKDKDLVVCKIQKDSPAKKASIEWKLHREIYRSRKDINAVFHSQPPYSTLIACAKDKKIKTELIPESIAYIKKIGVIPYQHPGSIELAKKVGEKARKADILLLENHGVVSLGFSIEEVINKTLTLEFLCKLIVLSKAADIELKPIPRDKITEFLKLMKELQSIRA